MATTNTRASPNGAARGEPPTGNGRGDVICILSDDDGATDVTLEAVVPAIKKEAADAASPRTPGTGSDADVTSTASPLRRKVPRARGDSDASPPKPTPPAGYETPVRPPRKRRSGAREEALKPITPSSTIQSSMNASLVFDMVTSLSTNDPGVAIATLRSIVVLGKEYPSNLLYDELIDRILSAESVAYDDAVSIYASLVFVFDRAAACSCDLTFPHLWEPLANALQDASVQPKGEAWRRNLLVLQFYVYCLKKDLDVCRERYARDEADWIHRTRLSRLLRPHDTTPAAGKKPKTKVQNNLILQAIGCGLQLWKRVFDATGDDVQFELEAEDACMAIVRLIEMLFMCTDQVQNMLQRVQAGLLELSRESRVKFAHVLESPELKIGVATTMMGLTNKSRSKENEWYECNAIGRVMNSIHSGASAAMSNDVMVTEGYSWSHFDSFMSSSSRSSVSRLIQEIARMESDSSH